MSGSDTPTEPVWSSRQPGIRARLLARLGTGPLAALTTRDPDDAAIALLDSWAAVLDVIAFYGDRIAAETYLRTAREARSVVELARMIGYELRPGLAATTALAFSVATQAGLPPVVAIPAGVRVQSTPGQDQQPQIYETLEALDARPAWNALAPTTAVAASVSEEAVELWLAADAVPPRPGDPLLVTDDSGQRAYVARATTIVPRPPAEPTRVGLDRPLRLGPACRPAAPPSPVALEAPVAYALRAPAHLYGHDAPPVPDDVRVIGNVHVLDVTAGTWTRIQDGLPGFAVTSVAVLTVDPEPPRFLVATAGRGVFRSCDGGASWAPASDGITDLAVLALCTDGATVWAGGTGGALWRSVDGGDRWERVGERTLVERRIHLRQLPGTTGLQPGDYQSAPLPDAIAVTGNGLSALTIHALAAGGGWLYAGNDEGVVASSDGGQTWLPTAMRSATRALTVAGSELVCGTTEPGVIIRLPLPPQTGQPVREAIDALGPAPASALAYVNAADPLAPATLVVGGGDTLLPAGADLPAVPLPAPDVRAVAAAGPGRLLVAMGPGPPATTDWPTLEPVPGQTWVDLDRVVADAQTAPWLVLDDGGTTGAFPVAGASTVVRSDLGPPTPVTRLTLTDAVGLQPWLGAGVRRTEVLLASGRIGLFPAPLGGRVMTLADPAAAIDLPAGRTIVVVGRRYPMGGARADERIGEQAVVAGTTATGIVLTEPLRETYHPGASMICANVVVASHGETVDAEVLGSGDARRANQTFGLARRPLTYLPAPTTTGARSTLRIAVNDVAWTEVPSLHQAGPRDQVYEIHHDADGATTIVFGDGHHGARLPSGAENVIASYRYGLGPAGEVAADSLVLLQTRPLGVQTVTNPLAATGGARPETATEARATAPNRVLTIGRVVAAEDVEAFARSFAGIGAATAALVSTPTATVMHVTVAGVAGQPVPAGSALAGALAGALDHARNRWRPLRIDSYLPVPVTVTARLMVAGDQAPEAVVAAAERTLADALAVTARGLARDLHRSEVITLLQRVPGVLAVDLDRLAVVGDASPGVAVVTTRPAQWQDGAIVPAAAIVLQAVSLTAASVPAPTR